jgi:hypothetical protein
MDNVPHNKPYLEVRDGALSVALVLASVKGQAGVT